MSRLFDSASSFDGDISTWDVSRVTNMLGMFYSASSFKGDISKWDVSRVTNMENMFYHASAFNGDLSKWDVSRVTDMRSMFAVAKSFAQTLCGLWITSKAKKDHMFLSSSGKIGTTCSSKKNTCHHNPNPDSDLP